MSEYRRWFVPGGTYFFTIVTYDRKPILTSDQGRQFLKQSVRVVRQTYPFQLFATVLLPDHWHLIMILPSGDDRYSTRIKRIKQEFTKSWLNAGLPEAFVSQSQLKRGERGVWQPRYWEHTIDSEHDLENHTHYIHWNPRKHGLVRQVRDWPWSSFHRFVEAGDYSIDWGGEEPPNIQAVEGE